MERREWAEREAEKLCKKHQYFSEPAIALAFKTEHARAVRIVKAEIKRVHMDERNYGIADQIIIVTALERVLAALTKGRA